MTKFVGIILITKDNKLALQKRDNKPNISSPGKLTVWGGMVEKGETVIQGAIRELGEELTIVVKQKQLKLFLKFKKYSPWLKKNILAHMYILKDMAAKDLKIQEGERILYVEPKLSAVKKLNLSVASKKTLFKYLENS